MGREVDRMRTLALFCAGVCAIVPAASGATAINEEVSLAMHVVATGEYLDCEDLCPAEMTCLDVNCDLSVAELQAAGGYGYVAFLAYNVDEAAALEFYVVGWPMGPETPDFTGPMYCAGEDAVLFGEPFEKRGGQGGAVVFPCEEPCTRMLCVCTIRFGPTVLDWLPISLQYAPSTFTQPYVNKIENCTDWITDPVIYEHGAVIGGDCEPIPNCYPGPSQAESESWGAIKALYR